MKSRAPLCGEMRCVINQKQWEVGGAGAALRAVLAGPLLRRSGVWRPADHEIGPASAACAFQTHRTTYRRKNMLGFVSMSA